MAVKYEELSPRDKAWADQADEASNDSGQSGTKSTTQSDQSTSGLLSEADLKALAEAAGTSSAWEDINGR